MARTRRQKKQVSDAMLVALVILTIAVSLIGAALTQLAVPVEQDVPVGTADVTANIPQSSASPVGRVSVIVPPLP